LPAILEIRDNGILLGPVTNVFRLGSFVEHSFAFTNATQIKVPSSGTSGSGSPYPSQISVSGAAGNISKIVLTLAGFSHAAPTDIDVLLVAPNGQAAIVMSDVGGASSISGITIKLDDFASAPLPNGALASGTFQPTNIDEGDAFPAPAPQGSFGSSLAIFNGTAANGVWSLYVLDDATQDKGSIGGWGLAITTEESACCTGNTAPVLAEIPNRTINELTTFTFTNSAADSDSTAISFSLGTNAPSGASVNPATGVFLWTPSEVQGPGIYNITLIATDNGSPNLSDSKAFQVTVNEVNSAPQLAAISNRTVHAGTTLILTNAALDSDFPSNTLSFSFNGTVSSGATLNSASGIFAWTPSDSQIGTNTFSIQVSDNGVPSLTASQGFTVVVRERPNVSVQRADNVATLTWPAISGANYRVQFKHDLNETVWNALTNATAAGTIASVEIPISNTNTFYRIEVVEE
jgi:subtilisin-like proprotein convertase family protein